jgi:electron transport complex protein RnfB
MPDNVYQKLAQRLDAIPNGFPPTRSGVELRLLAKIFTPDEAALAAVMRLAQEPAADIAARAGQDPETAYGTLKQMARKGSIYARKSGRELTFALMPFIVGIYESQLGQMDEEFAALFEQYFQESRGIHTRGSPSVHRVVPVEQSIPFGLEVFPYERASELVEAAKSWGVRNCICRVQQQLLGKGCDRPVESCVMLAPVEHAFDRSELSRPITKEDALRILREATEAGLVHSTGNFQDQHFYICNCCTCCCGVLRAVAEFDDPAAVARADFCAVVEESACIGCGDCVERCQFGALSVAEDFCSVEAERCVGCGLCAAACSNTALNLERRPQGKEPPPPTNTREWMVQRAQARDISLADLM